MHKKSFTRIDLYIEKKYLLTYLKFCEENRIAFSAMARAALAHFHFLLTVPPGPQPRQMLNYLKSGNA